MAKNDYGLLFKCFQKIARTVLPRFRFETPSTDDEPAVYVAHHQNMIGPISILVWLKYYVRTWVLGEFTLQEASYDHYTNFTFTKRYGWPLWLAKIVAWPVSYIVPLVAKSADVIPVYRGSRKIVQTMQISQKALMKGQDILIFPDIDYSDDSPEISDIYEGFLHLEKKYYRETNQHLAFIPVFSDQKERIVRVGREIRFTGKEKFIIERKEIAEELRLELNRLSEVK